MAKKQSKDDAEVRPEDLEKFEISINEFGEVDSSVKKEEINKFLNKFHQDKKIRKTKDTLEEE